MEGAFPPGAVLLGKYRVEGMLGRGGMGVVLRVTHLHLGEELAIKILAPESTGGADVQARFLREAQATVRLRGEHVTRVSDVGALPGGAPYIVMEYLRGADLSGQLAHRRTLPPGEIVDYVLQACEALAEAHALGIVHRDIKPSNLFLTARPDGTPLVKVLDFGISKAPLGGPGMLTRTNTVMGTPGYMSPEQMKASKDVDARTDIWSLGIVLYECLNGRRPFDAESYSAVVLRAATEPPPPMDPRIPRGLQAVVLRCLEKERAGRFQSMAALAGALAPFARDTRAADIVVERTRVMLRGPSNAVVQDARFGQLPSATTLSGSAGMLRQSSGRRYGGVAVLAGVVGVVVVGVLISSMRSSDKPRNGGQVAPGPGSSGEAVLGDGGLAVASQPADAVAMVAIAPTVDAAAKAVIAPPTEDAAAPTAISSIKPDIAAEEDEKATHCRKLEVQEDWQALRDCAGQLAALGAKGRAEEFRVKAVKEAANAFADDKIRKAIHAGNLKEAQHLLRGVSQDSVYWAKLNEAFKTSETEVTEDSKKKAQSLAALRDCAALKRFQAQLAGGAAGTPKVLDAANVKCVDKVAVAPTPPVAPAPRPPAGSSSGTAQNPTTPPTPPKNLICDTVNVEEIIGQSQNQFTAGFAKSALALLTKALDCKQDVRMYRMAALYACVAGDAVNAKFYYAKITPQFQSQIVQRCQQEGISLPKPTASIPTRR